jgi:uncharacterized protein (TIGR02270 family)
MSSRWNDPTQRPVVAVILQQHAEDAAVLHTLRSALVSAPHVRLGHLQRFDDRLEAHLDGLAIAGERADPYIGFELEKPSAGATFVATVQAIARLRNRTDGVEKLDRMLALGAMMRSCQRGLLSAFGWAEAEELSGLVTGLLQGQSPHRRLAGVAACSMHRVDPGLMSARRLEDPDPAVRARAWRTAGELGTHQFVSRAAAATADDDPGVRFWAAWSAVLLGDKRSALEVLRGIAVESGPFRSRAFQLEIQAVSVAAGHALLKPLAQDPANTRRLIRGAALVGDPTYVPWLIGLMPNDQLARAAGEAFCMIAGVDLAWLDLERKPPKDFESGPNDNPEDANVASDEDDGLPWPDQSLVQGWWDANSHRFQSGVRYFAGEPLNRENCLRVLKEGFQRQRIAAAFYLSLLNPGTPLFEWRAPAWRQQHLLAQMS